MTILPGTYLKLTQNIEQRRIYTVFIFKLSKDHKSKYLAAAQEMRVFSEEAVIKRIKERENPIFIAGILRIRPLASPVFISPIFVL